MNMGYAMHNEVPRERTRVKTAVIFNIERHALHDGPGIRTLVFFKGCTLRCLWCSNPEGQAGFAELLYRAKDCVSCMRCAEACPAGAVSPAIPGASSRDRPRASVDSSPGGRPSGDRVLLVEAKSVVTDRTLCTVCGACVPVCPTGARTIAGRTMTALEALDAVLKDELFYRNSGGGVTASGGEPLLRPVFVRELFEMAGAHGIHRAIETCGHVPWESVETVLPFTDLFLYDLKHIDPGVHLRFTAMGNSLILDNLGRLDESGAGIELLPYHVLGRSKYHHLEKEYPMEGHGLLPMKTLERLLSASREINPNTTLEI